MKFINLLIVLFISLFIISAIADKNPQSSTPEIEDSNEKDDNSREIEIEQEDHKIKIESFNKVGDVKNKLEITVMTSSSDHMKFKVKFFSQNGTSKARFFYRVMLTHIIEYNESNSQNGCQAEEYLTEYDIGKVVFSPVVKDSLNISGKIVNKFNFTTTDGIFSLIMYVGANNFITNGKSIDPKSFKFDIRINNFNYSTNTSRICLKGKIQTALKTKRDRANEDVKEGQLDLSESDSSQEGGFLTWDKTVSTDAGDVQVFTSDATESVNDPDEEQDNERDENNSESVKVLTFSFDAVNPKFIFWDPVIGVTSSTSKFLINLPLFGMLIGLVYVLL